MTAPPACTKFVALTVVLLVLNRKPLPPAASVPPLKLNAEPTPPKVIEDTFVNMPLGNNVTKLFVTVGSLPICADRPPISHSDTPVPPPTLTELLAQLVMPM